MPAASRIKKLCKAVENISFHLADDAPRFHGDFFRFIHAYRYHLQKISPNLAAAYSDSFQLIDEQLKALSTKIENNDEELEQHAKAILRHFIFLLHCHISVVKDFPRHYERHHELDVMLNTFLPRFVYLCNEHLKLQLNSLSDHKAFIEDFLKTNFDKKGEASFFNSLWGDDTIRKALMGISRHTEEELEPEIYTNTSANRLACAKLYYKLNYCRSFAGDLDDEDEQLVTTISKNLKIFKLDSLGPTIIADPSLSQNANINQLQYDIVSANSAIWSEQAKRSSQRREKRSNKLVAASVHAWNSIDIENRYTPSESPLKELEKMFLTKFSGSIKQDIKVLEGLRGDDEDAGKYQDIFDELPLLFHSVITHVNTTFKIARVIKGEQARKHRDKWIERYYNALPLIADKQSKARYYNVLTEIFHMMPKDHEFCTLIKERLVINCHMLDSEHLHQLIDTMIEMEKLNNKPEKVTENIIKEALSRFGEDKCKWVKRISSKKPRTVKEDTSLITLIHNRNEIIRKIKSKPWPWNWRALRYTLSSFFRKQPRKSALQLLKVEDIPRVSNINTETNAEDFKKFIQHDAHAVSVHHDSLITKRAISQVSLEINDTLRTAVFKHVSHTAPLSPDQKGKQPTTESTSKLSSLFATPKEGSSSFVDYDDYESEDEYDNTINQLLENITELSDAISTLTEQEKTIRQQLSENANGPIDTSVKQQNTQLSEKIQTIQREIKVLKEEQIKTKTLQKYVEVLFGFDKQLKQICDNDAAEEIYRHIVPKLTMLMEWARIASTQKVRLQHNRAECAAVGVLIAGEGISGLIDGVPWVRRIISIGGQGLGAAIAAKGRSDRLAEARTLSSLTTTNLFSEYIVKRYACELIIRRFDKIKQIHPDDRERFANAVIDKFKANLNGYMAHNFMQSSVNLRQADRMVKLFVDETCQENIEYEGQDSKGLMGDVQKLRKHISNIMARPLRTTSISHSTTVGDVLAASTDEEQQDFDFNKRVNGVVTALTRVHRDTITGRLSQVEGILLQVFGKSLRTPTHSFYEIGEESNSHEDNEFASESSETGTSAPSQAFATPCKAGSSDTMALVGRTPGPAAITDGTQEFQEAFRESKHLRSLMSRLEELVSTHSKFAKHMDIFIKDFYGFSKKHPGFTKLAFYKNMDEVIKNYIQPLSRTYLQLSPGRALAEDEITEDKHTLFFIYFKNFLRQIQRDEFTSVFLAKLAMMSIIHKNFNAQETEDEPATQSRLINSFWSLFQSKLPSYAESLQIARESTVGKKYFKHSITTDHQAFDSIFIKPVQHFTKFTLFFKNDFPRDIQRLLREVKNLPGARNEADQKFIAHIIKARDVMKSFSEHTNSVTSYADKATELSINTESISTVARGISATFEGSRSLHEKRTTPKSQVAPDSLCVQTSRDAHSKLTRGRDKGTRRGVRKGARERLFTEELPTSPPALNLEEGSSSNTQLTSRPGETGRDTSPTPT